MPRTEMQPAARERLFEAMLLELAERGYDAMKVADVLTLSGISKADFAAEFADKDACLFAAYEQLTERLTRKIVEGCALGEEWPQRVRGGLFALLEELAGAPEMARVAVRTFPAISPEARAHYQELIEGFASLLTGGREFSSMGAELPAEVEMLAVGAAEAIVFEEIEAGRAVQLPALGPAILFSVLVPFLGPEAASAEMQRASEAAERRDLEAA
jgi:AcrR family transcriptional regulator